MARVIGAVGVEGIRYGREGSSIGNSSSISILRMSGLKLTDPRWPPLERLNQQVPQQSGPPFGICPTSCSQPTCPGAIIAVSPPSVETISVGETADFKNPYNRSRG